MLTWSLVLQAAAAAFGILCIGWIVRGWSEHRHLAGRQSHQQRQLQTSFQRHASLVAQEITKLKSELGKLKADVLALQTFHRTTRARNAALPVVSVRADRSQSLLDSFADTQPFER
jgi:hypothetical protein